MSSNGSVSWRKCVAKSSVGEAQAVLRAVAAESKQRRVITAAAKKPGGKTGCICVARAGVLLARASVRRRQARAQPADHRLSPADALPAVQLSPRQSETAVWTIGMRAGISSTSRRGRW